MAWKKNSKNRLEDREAALIKAMLQEGNHTDQDILAYFTRPDRSINHARIIEIRNGLTFQNVSAATPAELKVFRGRWTHPAHQPQPPPSPPELFGPPEPPRTACLKPAYERLWWGIQSVNALWSLFHEKAAAGVREEFTTNQLRAMVLFAGATLDATLKQALLVAIPELMRVDAVRHQIEERFHRRLFRGDRPDTRTLVDALLSESPRQRAGALIVEDITGGSLQSVEAVQNVTALLGIKRFSPDKSLRAAFTVRNQIVHEMDATSAGPRERDTAKMKNHAEALLGTATSVLLAVDRALGSAQGS